MNYSCLFSKITEKWECMDKIKVLNGENNKLIFILPNGEEISEFTDEEIEILNNSGRINITGDNNTVIIKIKDRKDILTVLKNQGFILQNFGNNNTI